MRLRRILIVLITAMTSAAIGLAQESVMPAASDCTLGLAQMHSPEREIWRTLTVHAEQLAPSTAAVTPGRGRAALPPSGPQRPQYKSVNFIDDEIFGKMMRAGIVATAISGDAEFLRRVTLSRHSLRTTALTSARRSSISSSLPMPSLTAGRCGWAILCRSS